MTYNWLFWFNLLLLLFSFIQILIDINYDVVLFPLTWIQCLSLWVASFFLSLFLRSFFVWIQCKSDLFLISLENSNVDVMSSCVFVNFFSSKNKKSTNHGFIWLLSLFHLCDLNRLYPKICLKAVDVRKRKNGEKQFILC